MAVPWRQQQDSSRVDDDEDQQQDSGMWRNPFGTPRPLTAEEIDHSGGSVSPLNAKPAGYLPTYLATRGWC